MHCLTCDLPEWFTSLTMRMSRMPMTSFASKGWIVTRGLLGLSVAINPIR
jgi:hypothetical protein